MHQTIGDLFKYIKYHFFEASVYNGSSFPYRVWAAKRIFKVLLNGRKKSESYLYPADVIIKNKEGLFFVPTRTDLILNISSKTEANLLPYFTIEKGKTFLDIGANAGKWSIHIAKSSSDNKVLAFEPIPSTFKVIRKNISLNKLEERVTVLNIGLSNQNSVIEFAYNSSFTGINGVFTEDVKGLPEGFELVKIPVRKLDEVIIENGIDVSLIDLIKIDVEGHELSVIQGATDTFKGLPAGVRLLIEIDVSSKTKPDTLKLLADLGFTRNTELDSINFLFRKD